MSSTSVVYSRISPLIGAFLFLFLVAGTAPAAGPEPPAVWTLENAVIFGLQNSPDSRIALQRIESARASQAEADALLRHPRVGLSAVYGQTNNPIYSFGNILNQGVFTNDIDFNDPGRTDNLNLMAELTYRLYNGGRDQAGLNAAASGYRATREALREVQQQLGFEIVRAFQRIVQAGDQLGARQAELEAIDSSLQVAKARYDAGDLLKTEVLNFEVQKARTSENLIIAQHQKSLAEKSFLNLLGLESGTVTLSQSDADISADPERLSPRPRPEFARLSAMLEAAEADLEGARANNRPTFDGFASYQYDYGWVNDGSGDSWLAGVKLNYSLWDGRRGTAEIARKEAEYREVEEQLHKLELAINLDMEEARLNYQQAVERSGVTEKMVEVARESAQLSRERFKEGVILSSDLLDTEVRLTEALVRQSAARANYRTAAANLRRALGYQQFADATEELMENAQ
jgi:outer membrane protein TolC